MPNTYYNEIEQLRREFAGLGTPPPSGVPRTTRPPSSAPISPDRPVLPRETGITTTPAYPRDPLWAAAIKAKPPPPPPQPPAPPSPTGQGGPPPTAPAPAATPQPPPAIPKVKVDAMPLEVNGERGVWIPSVTVAIPERPKTTTTIAPLQPSRQQTPPPPVQTAPPPAASQTSGIVGGQTQPKTPEVGVSTYKPPTYEDIAAERTKIPLPPKRPARPVYANDAHLSPELEQKFQAWYQDIAVKTGLWPDPDDVQHRYWYRRAFLADAGPDAKGHWPSAFKAPTHPQRYVKGEDTITGQPATREEVLVPGARKVAAVPDDTVYTAKPPKVKPVKELPTGKAFIAKKVMTETIVDNIVVPTMKAGALASSGYAAVMASALNGVLGLVRKAIGVDNAMRKRMGLKPTRGTAQTAWLQATTDAWAQAAQDMFDLGKFKNAGVAGDIANSLYKGLGEAGMAIPMIQTVAASLPAQLQSLALPIVSGIQAGQESPRDIAIAMAHGYVLHHVLAGANLVPKRIGVPLSGAMFATMEALNGGSLEDIVSSGILGSVLQFMGPAPDYKQWKADRIYQTLEDKFVAATRKATADRPPAERQAVETDAKNFAAHYFNRVMGQHVYVAGQVQADVLRDFDSFVRGVYTPRNQQFLEIYRDIFKGVDSRMRGTVTAEEPSARPYTPPPRELTIGVPRGTMKSEAQREARYAAAAKTPEPRQQPSIPRSRPPESSGLLPRRPEQEVLRRRTESPESAVSPQKRGRDTETSVPLARHGASPLEHRKTTKAERDLAERQRVVDDNAKAIIPTGYRLIARAGGWQYVDPRGDVRDLHTPDEISVGQSKEDFADSVLAHATDDNFFGRNFETDDGTVVHFPDNAETAQAMREDDPDAFDKLMTAFRVPAAFDITTDAISATPATMAGDRVSNRLSEEMFHDSFSRLTPTEGRIVLRKYGTEDDAFQSPAYQDGNFTDSPADVILKKIRRGRIGTRESRAPLPEPRERIGERGVQTRQQEDTETADRFAAEPRARTPAPPFFSQLRRVIEQKMPNRATAQVVRNIVDPAKGSGVKADELKWSGLSDFLDARKAADTVTKDEVLAATMRESVLFQGQPRFAAEPTSGVTRRGEGGKGGVVNEKPTRQRDGEEVRRADGTHRPPAGTGRTYDAASMERRERELGAILRGLAHPERRTAVTPAQDADYMAAVIRGDTATAQKMADEAAKKAGYNVGPVWHGTPDKFTVFASKTGMHWFASKQEAAEPYRVKRGPFPDSAKANAAMRKIEAGQELSASEAETLDEALAWWGAGQDKGRVLQTRLRISKPLDLRQYGDAETPTQIRDILRRFGYKPEDYFVIGQRAKEELSEALKHVGPLVLPATTSRAVGDTMMPQETEGLFDILSEAQATLERMASGAHDGNGLSGKEPELAAAGLRYDPQSKWVGKDGQRINFFGIAYGGMRTPTTAERDAYWGVLERRKWERRRDSAMKTLASVKRHADEDLELPYEYYRGMAKRLRDLGYDSLVVQEQGQTSFAVLDPSQIKSADPITRDDQGNVIPLSKRFQTAEPDIRFAAEPRQSIVISEQQEKAIRSAAFDAKSAEEAIHDIRNVPTSIAAMLPQWTDGDDLVSISMYGKFFTLAGKRQIAPQSNQPYRPANRLHSGEIAWNPNARTHGEALYLWLEQQGRNMEMFNAEKEVYGSGAIGPDGRYYEQRFIGDAVIDFDEMQRTKQLGIRFASEPKRLQPWRSGPRAVEPVPIRITRPLTPLQREKKAVAIERVEMRKELAATTAEAEAEKKEAVGAVEAKYGAVVEKLKASIKQRIADHAQQYKTGIENAEDLAEKQLLLQQYVDTALPAGEARRWRGRLVKALAKKEIPTPESRQQFVDEAKAIIDDMTATLETNALRKRVMAVVEKEKRLLRKGMAKGKRVGMPAAYTDALVLYLSRLNGLTEADAAELENLRMVIEAHPEDPPDDSVMERLADLGRPSVDKMTADELTEVLKDIRFIKRTGRSAWKIEREQRQAELQAESEAIAAALDVAEGITPLERKRYAERAVRNLTRRTRLGSAIADVGKRYGWQLIRPERIAEWMEGYDKSRPMSKAVWDRALAAEEAEIVGVEKAFEAFKAIWKDVVIPETYGGSQDIEIPTHITLQRGRDAEGNWSITEIPEVIKVRPVEAIFIYAQAQSEGGMAHLRGTGIHDDGVNAAQAWLEKNLPAAIPAVTATFLYEREQQYPRMSSIFRDRHGVSMPMVENHLRIDRLETARHEVQQASDILARHETRMPASVSKGMMISRTGSTAPFREMDYFRTVIQSIVDAEHVIAWDKPIWEINTVLANRDVREAMKARSEMAMRELDNWTRAIASGKIQRTDNAIDIASDFLRTNVIGSYLAGNIVSLMTQWASVFNGLQMLKNPAEFAASLGRFAVNPVGMADDIFAKSPAMRSRLHSFERELAEMYEAGTFKRWTGKMSPSDVRDFLLKGQTIFDLMVTLPLWDAKYREVLDRELKRGVADAAASERQARKEADGVIRRSQSIGGLAHLPGLYRAGGLARAVTTFTASLNQTVNQLWETTMRAIYESRGATTPKIAKNIWRVIYAVLLMLVAQGLFVEFMRLGFRLPNKARAWADAMLGQVSGGIPVVGDMIMRGVNASIFGRRPSDFYRDGVDIITLGVLEDMVRLGQKPKDVEKWLDVVGNFVAGYTAVKRALKGAGEVTKEGWDHWRYLIFPKGTLDEYKKWDKDRRAGKRDKLFPGWRAKPQKPLKW